MFHHWKKFQLKWVHIHGNNWDDYGENNIPSSIELSFSRNPKLTSYNLEFPHSLDQKNNPKFDELKLIFDDWWFLELINIGSNEKN